MTRTSSDDPFRKAAEEEGGMPVSAGARVAHNQLALESGRALHLDLSGVPKEKRSDLVAEITELVNRASTGSKPASIGVTNDSATSPG